MNDVIAKLKKAFKLVKPSNNLTRDVKNIAYPDSIWFCDNLLILNHDDAYYLLPQILIDLCLTEKQGIKRINDTRNVLSYLGLGGGSLDKNFTITNFGPLASEIEIQETSHLSKEAKIRFFSFTKIQANAILCWLNAIAEWKGYGCCSEELKNAVSYWEERAF